MGTHDIGHFVNSTSQETTLEHYRQENNRLAKAHYRATKMLSSAQTTMSDQAVFIVELEQRVREQERELQICRETIARLQNSIHSFEVQK